MPIPSGARYCYISTTQTSALSRASPADMLSPSPAAEQQMGKLIYTVVDNPHDTLRDNPIHETGWGRA